MQESPPQATQQSPPPDQLPQSPPNTSRAIMSNSSPSSPNPQEVKEIATSPRNGQPTFITPSGGRIGVGPGSEEKRRSFQRNSSPESVAESQIYAVSVKYKSAVGEFQEHIACGFSNLYATSELADVTIACEGKLCKAHKIVLAISSPYFRHIFKELNELPCQHPIIILHGIKLKDWENVMRLIYHGIVHICSNEIDDFISTAECLKIDGLCAEDHHSSRDDISPSYDYRFSGSEFASRSPEESGAGQQQSYRGYSPENYRYDGTSDPSPRGGEISDQEQGSLPIYQRRSQNTPTRHISSSQSSPGVVGRDTLLKIETGENYRQGEDLYEVHSGRPPSCPEGLSRYTLPSVSPSDSHIQGVRHPVILRRRNQSLNHQPDGDEHYEIPMQGSSEGRMVRNSRNSQSYQSGWDPHNLSGGENLVIDKERPFQTVISGHTSAGLVPLSAISRQLPPPALPLQLINPGFLHRMPQMQMIAQAQRAHGERGLHSGGGVITTVSSPHPSPQAHEQQMQFLRDKIAAGQSIYSRGLRPERQHSNVYGLPRFTSSAQGSSSQLSPHEAFATHAGPSRSNLYVPSVINSHQPQPSIARPKTKAIRSSQVPQSARYTAAEVDAMVEKVQNYAGNLVPCTICSKFVKRERLRAHVHECHLRTPDKRIMCPQCGIGLKSKGSYRVHIWRHKRGTLPTTRQRQQDQLNPHN